MTHKNRPNQLSDTVGNPSHVTFKLGYAVQTNRMVQICSDSIACFIFKLIKIKLRTLFFTNESQEIKYLKTSLKKQNKHNESFYFTFSFLEIESIFTQLYPFFRIFKHISALQIGEEDGERLSAELETL